MPFPIPDSPFPAPATPDATIDLGRAERCGFPEVVYGPGKRPETVAEIFAVQQAHGQACLATRVDAEQAAAVRSRFPQAIWNDLARTIRLESPGGQEPPAGLVAVLTAGTTDRP